MLLVELNLELVVSRKSILEFIANRTTYFRHIHGLNDKRLKLSGMSITDSD